MANGVTPLHGRNQFPDASVPGLRPAVLNYIDAVTNVSHRLMELICVSLKLDPQYIRRHVTYDAIQLGRLFYYPPTGDGHVAQGTSQEAAGARQEGGDTKWGIGEHTDYGLWTIILQDKSGLQFKRPDAVVGAGSDASAWADVPYVPDGEALVCNVGDVLDRMTGGRFVSPLHRARNPGPGARLTSPFFFDPSWDADMRPLPLDHLGPAPSEGDGPRARAIRDRWSRTSIRELSGPYSGFLAKKVSKVFADVIPGHVADSLTTTTGPSSRFAIKIPVGQGA